MTNSSSVLETMPIPKLILKQSLPMIFAGLINNLYNIVDSLYVSSLGENALSALSLAAPIQLLIAAFGTGIAVGINALVSQGLGERNDKKVKYTASAGILLGLLAAVILAVLSLTVVKPFFAWQTSNTEIFNYGADYLGICMFFSLGQMLQWVFDRFIISSGKSNLFLVSLVSASMTNIVLDPILIFGLFGMPALGVKGAAIATVIGQSVGALVSICVNHFFNKEIPLTLQRKDNIPYALSILKIGMPAAVMQGIVSLSGIVINTILTAFTSTAVAVYGICLKVLNIALIIPNGISLALVPIVSYNFGAKNPIREKEALQYSLKISIVSMFFVTLLIILFSKQILMLFHATPNMLQIGIPAMCMIAAAMFLSTFAIILSSMLQALQQSGQSMILTVFRQSIVLIPLVWLSSLLGSLNLIWLAFILAEAAGIGLGLCIQKQKIIPMLQVR